jgi:chitin synthase
VPFIVLVKVGNRNEFSKPGNRGKRDSQLILMRFLSRIHFRGDMNPLELELMHQMKNIIGIHPSSYEFLLQLDADTVLLTNAVRLCNH